MPPVRGGGSHQSTAIPFGTKKLEWWGYLTVKKFWGYVQRCRQNTRVWQIDRQTSCVGIVRAMHMQHAVKMATHHKQHLQTKQTTVLITTVLLFTWTFCTVNKWCVDKHSTLCHHKVENIFPLIHDAVCQLTSFGVLCAAHRKIHCSVAVICVQVSGLHSGCNEQHSWANLYSTI